MRELLKVWKRREPVRIRGAAWLLPAALLFAVQGVAAQAPKKYVMPDGSTVYSDKPVPGGKLMGEVAVPPPLDRAAVEAARKREAERATQADKMVEERLKGRTEERNRIEEATAKLEQARRQLDAGRAPKPGERIGTAGGGSRFTDEYVARQRLNEQAVKQAEEALQKARGR